MEPTPIPATILVVDDSRDVRVLLQRMLGEQGYRVHTAEDGTSGLHLALDIAPDLVILDVGLPGRTGLEVTAELRRRAFRAPVLLLTARGTVGDKVSGLDAGADDYLAKPFERDELVARVKALLRRSSMRALGMEIRVGDIALDPIARTVRRGADPIALTQTEFALLEYLMRNAGREVTREMIATNVWKQPIDRESNIVDVYVAYLRKKLEGNDGRKLLHTVRGVGYMLQA